tara:strand:+ start:955 stop:1329 length:375 start_codon:yes stop_codon:yes gene_type:complete
MKNKIIFINKSISNDMLEVGKIEFGADSVGRTKLIKKNTILNRLIDIWDNTSDEVKNYIIKFDFFNYKLGSNSLPSELSNITFGVSKISIYNKYLAFKKTLPSTFKWGDSKALNVLLINYFSER